MSKTTTKKVAKKAAKKTAAKASASKKVAAKKTAAKKTAAKKPTAKKAAAKKASAKKKPVAKKAAAKAPASKKKAAASKPAAKKVAAKKTAASKKKTATAKDNAKTADTKSAAKKAATKKTATKLKSSLFKMPPVTEIAAVEPVAVSRDRSEHYMSSEQLAKFSAMLAEWKQQLLDGVDRTVDHMKDDASNFPDPNDRATQEEEFSFELRTRDRERKLIKKINEAQKRIEENEYGYCETCGIEIGVERLEARLTAELCIDCKTLEEIRERQTA